MDAWRCARRRASWACRSSIPVRRQPAGQRSRHSSGSGDCSDRGRVVRWKVSYRGLDEAEHELRVWGRVKKKYLEGDEGRLDLDVGVTGPDGRESTPGMATVVLPRSRAAEVPAT